MSSKKSDQLVFITISEDSFCAHLDSSVQIIPSFKSSGERSFIIICIISACMSRSSVLENNRSFWDLIGDVVSSSTKRCLFHNFSNSFCLNKNCIVTFRDDSIKSTSLISFFESVNVTSKTLIGVSAYVDTSITSLSTVVESSLNSISRIELKLT